MGRLNSTEYNKENIASKYNDSNGQLLLYAYDVLGVILNTLHILFKSYNKAFLWDR